MLKELGAVVVCPESKIKQLGITIKSLQNLVLDSNVIAVTPNKSFDIENIKTIQGNCSRQTSDFTPALINQGLNSTKTSWNLVIIAGFKIKLSVFKKIELFVSRENDILYPINSKRSCIEDGLTWMVFNKVLFKKSQFNEDLFFEQAKFIWLHNMLQEGCQLKGIFG